ncbi:glycosyltransferase family 34 protein [Viridothelium virens]|uniref:Glycosyltransferase family 34 protein n=1 Tax=Viridothelium virens TaxID=1048519 RepID=A0A6A6HFD2_VIRVR|nr:glycosyltransferase family 34 protein [Viridothelium virens]
MHFAFPPRKSSHPPPYAVRSSRSSPLLRRQRLRNWGLLATLAVFTIFLLSRYSGTGGSEKIPSGTPPCVIVTIIDQEAPSAFIRAIKDNRNDYAARHGYGTFFPNVTDYNLDDAPFTWSKVPAMRHAMTLFPYSTYFFYLTSFALIMNPSISIEAHIMDRERLETTMLVEKPVVPPDSIIKTFPNIRGDKIDFVLTQDREGLSQDSFVIRRGEWAKYFLDAWFDPLYRSYNFQKAERHALEHIVQWHGTILAKLALVPQRILNSYLRDPSGGTEGVYAEGDFVVNFFGCDLAGDRNCEEEMTPMITRWREIRDRRGY